MNHFGASLGFNVNSSSDVIVKSLGGLVLLFAAVLGVGGAQPVEISHVGQFRSFYPFGAYAVAVSGHYVYTAGGLQVIDISNPAKPVSVGGTNTSGGPNAIAVSGNRLYAAEDYGFGDGRLEVFDISSPANPVRL